MRLSDFSTDYIFHCSISPIDSLSIARVFQFNVRLKLPQNILWTDEITHVISTNTGMNWVTLAVHIRLVTYLLCGCTNAGMNGVRLAHHISLVTYLLHGSFRNRDKQWTLRENKESPKQGRIPKLRYTSGVICTTLKRENSNTEMDGVTLAHHISLVTYLVFGSTNTGMNANRHQWFICTALKREKSKNPWLKRIGAILNKSTTTRPTKYPVTRSTDFLV